MWRKLHGSSNLCLKLFKYRYKPLQTPPGSQSTWPKTWGKQYIYHLPFQLQKLVFPKIVVPQNGWFIMENPINMGWFGGHYFRKHSFERRGYIFSTLLHGKYLKINQVSDLSTKNPGCSIGNSYKFGYKIPYKQKVVYVIPNKRPDTQPNQEICFQIALLWDFFEWRKLSSKSRRPISKAKSIHEN